MSFVFNLLLIIDEFITYSSCYRYFLPGCPFFIKFVCGFFDQIEYLVIIYDACRSFFLTSKFLFMLRKSFPYPNILKIFPYIFLEFLRTLIHVLESTYNFYYIVFQIANFISVLFIEVPPLSYNKPLYIYDSCSESLCFVALSYFSFPLPVPCSL